MALDGLVEINVKLVVSADGPFAIRATAVFSFVLVVFEGVHYVIDQECGHPIFMRPGLPLRTDRRVHLAHGEFRVPPPVVPDELSPETDNSHWSGSDVG